MTAVGSIARFISNDNFTKLEGIMYPKHTEAGDYLFWEGDETGKLYFLKSGRVKLRKTTDDGKDLIISILQKGDLIGEMDEDDKSMHSYSAEVMEDAEIGVIQQKDLEVLLYQHGEFAIQFTKWLAMKHKTTESKFRDLMLFGKNGALASTLIRMSNSFGVMCADGIRIDLKINNTEMADMIGSTRESVNRMLNALKEEGTIDMKNGKIIIRNLKNLRGVCNCPDYPACPIEICRL